MLKTLRSVNFKVFEHLLVPSGDNIDKNKVVCCYSFENRNRDYIDRYVTTFTFSALVTLNKSMWFFFQFFLFLIILNIKLSALKQCNNTMNITLYVFYLQILFYFSFYCYFPILFMRRGKDRGHRCCLFTSLSSFILQNAQLIPGRLHLNRQCLSAMHPWSMLYSPIWVLSNSN